MGKSGKVSKVPANETEALSSDLMGLFEKRRFKNCYKTRRENKRADKARAQPPWSFLLVRRKAGTRGVDGKR